MKLKNIYLLSVCCLGLFFSCSEEKLGPSIIEIPDGPRTPTEIYIDTLFTERYNMNIIYKWTAAQTDLSKTLVPPKEELIIPFLQTVQKAWINPYLIADSASSLFDFSIRVPRDLMLIGSPGMNDDGTITQGTAEAGEKIVLYQINDFNRKNISGLQRYFHVMHHEFAHIFHQTVMFPPEFEKISAGLYISNWYDKTNAQARELGFVTNYAMSEYHEDFVEIIAVMLTHSKDEWDAFLLTIPESGRSKILQKVTHVVNYYKKTWNIDIYKLQADINKEIIDISNETKSSAVQSEHKHTNVNPDPDVYYEFSPSLNCGYCRGRHIDEQNQGTIKPTK